MFPMLCVLMALPSAYSSALRELDYENFDNRNETVFEKMIRTREFVPEIVEIEGFCRIMKSDHSLPKIRGICKNYQDCSFEMDIDGHRWGQNVALKTCQDNGPSAECFVPAIVTKNVRCLLDEPQFLKTGFGLFACLDSTEAGINVNHMVTYEMDDPQILDTKGCNAWKRKKTRG